jgi:hypothetical protein
MVSAAHESHDAHAREVCRCRWRAPAARPVAEQEALSPPCATTSTVPVAFHRDANVRERGVEDVTERVVAVSTTGGARSARSRTRPMGVARRRACARRRMQRQFGECTSVATAIRGFATICAVWRAIDAYVPIGALAIHACDFAQASRPRRQRSCDLRRSRHRRVEARLRRAAAAAACDLWASAREASRARRDQASGSSSPSWSRSSTTRSR